ncbi:MAG: NAD(P)-binding domain-containing protein [Saprospiraceae bacterium]
MKSKIGILGSGAVAKALAAGFLDLGHEVMVGSSDSSKLEEIKRGLNILTGTFQQASAFGNILVLAVKGSAAIKVCSNLNAEDVNGKTIIDTTNPISDNPPVNGVLQYFTPQNDSLGAQLQKNQTGAHIVKAFNSVGSHLMYKPNFAGGKPGMFICGNDDGAKAEVSKILEDFGWEVEDMGSIDASETIESLCVLWCIRGFKENKWVHAFKLLK